MGFEISLATSFNKFGGKLIDTSPMYGNSEYIIGKLNKDFELNKQLFFATKVWTNGKKNGEKQIKNSFNCLLFHFLAFCFFGLFLFLFTYFL